MYTITVSINTACNYRLFWLSLHFNGYLFCLFLILGEPIDIMKPRAIAACNDKIARDVVKIIREADQRVDMRAK